ncbi:MAG: PQQ-binding-like beta-propeller repeat protein [Patescibacteria group bacterium]
MTGLFFCLPYSVQAAPVTNDDLGVYTDDFADNTGVPTRSGANVNTSTGVLQLTNTSNDFSAPFRESGYVITGKIRPLRVAKWGTVNITGIFPEGTSVKLQVLDEGNTLYADTYLPSNSTGVSSFPVDISGISPLTWADGDNGEKVPSIKFKLLLSTTNPSVTPEIDSFTFTWTLSQGDLSASALDTSSPWYKNSRYGNSSVYPAFRWAAEKNTGNSWAPQIFVFNDRLFVTEGWWNGRMYTLDRDTGTVINQMAFHSVGISVVSQNGTGYSRSMGDDLLTAFDTVNSTIKWVYNFKGGHGSGVTIGNDGTIFTFWNNSTGRDNILYAFAPDSTIKWMRTYTLGAEGDTSLSISNLLMGDDGILYYAYYSLNGSTITPNGELIALDPNSGDELWTYPLGYTNDLRPLLGSNGVIYLGDYDSTGNRQIKLLAINSSDGSLKWSKDFGVVGDKGFLDALVETADGNITARFINAASKKVVYHLDKDSGEVLWSQTKDYVGDLGTDNRKGYYYSGWQDSGNPLISLPILYYADSNFNTKWQIPYFYVPQEDDHEIFFTFSPAALDERGWVYYGVAESATDEEWNSVHSKEYAQVFALAPWTLTQKNNAPTYSSAGREIEFTATSSMRETNPLFGGENKVQVVIDNGDKVLLSYDSTDSNGDSVWKGTYTIPQDMPDGEHTYIVEASQAHLQTDIATHFASAPTQSNNTGITIMRSFRVDNTPPQLELVSPSGNTNSETRPTLVFKKAADALGKVTSYSVKLEGSKTRSYFLSGIPASWGNSLWRDDNEVKVEFSDQEIKVYFKGLDSNPLGEGRYSWAVTAYDEAGNFVTKESEFFLDTTSPETSELALANISLLSRDGVYRLNSLQKMPSFSGKVIDPKSNEISSGMDKIILDLEKKTGDGYEKYLTKEYPAQERFYLSTPFPLLDGYYRAQLSFIDKAGNKADYVFYLSLGKQAAFSNKTSPLSGVISPRVSPQTADKQITTSTSDTSKPSQPTLTPTPLLQTQPTPIPPPAQNSIFSSIKSFFSGILNFLRGK